jgi:hypothetical protein
MESSGIRLGIRLISNMSAHSSNKRKHAPQQDDILQHYRISSFFPTNDIRGNPHCWQRLAHGPSCGSFESRKSAVQFSRTLDMDSFPATAYRRRQGEAKTTLHWGQRKLFLAEVEFLSKYTMHSESDREKTYDVVYAGAAPGTHLVLLREWFPNCVFHCYDPRTFDGSLQEVADVFTHIRCFQDDDATIWSHPQQISSSATYGHERLGADINYGGVLFIADIRTGDWQKMSDECNERCCAEDLAAMERWVHLMKPKKAMLKFRLPYSEDPFEESVHLAGDIFFPVFGPQTTTESRLVCDATSGTKIYNHKLYNEQLFHFNTQVRVSLYGIDSLDSPIVSVDDPFRSWKGGGICRCYDCSSELYILGTYLQARNSDNHFGECDLSQSFAIRQFPDERPFESSQREWRSIFEDKGMDGFCARLSKMTDQKSLVDRFPGKGKTSAMPKEFCPRFSTRHCVPDTFVDQVFRLSGEVTRSLGARSGRTLFTCCRFSSLHQGKDSNKGNVEASGRNNQPHNNQAKARFKRKKFTKYCGSD